MAHDVTRRGSGTITRRYCRLFTVASEPCGSDPSTNLSPRSLLLHLEAIGNARCSSRVSRESVEDYIRARMPREHPNDAPPSNSRNGARPHTGDPR